MKSSVKTIIVLAALGLINTTARAETDFPLWVAAEVQQTKDDAAKAAVQRTLAEARAYHTLTLAALAPKNILGIHPLRPDANKNAPLLGHWERVVVDVPAGEEMVFEAIYWSYRRHAVLHLDEIERGPQGVKIVFYAHHSNALARFTSFKLHLYSKLKKIIFETSENDPANIIAREIALWACEARHELNNNAAAPMDLGYIFDADRCHTLFQ